MLCSSATTLRSILFVRSWNPIVRLKNHCLDLLHQLSGLSLLGPMNSTPSTGMSFSLMAFCTHRWYFRKVSEHGSPLRSPFRNFSANQRLKHWSYSRFSSVQPSPTLFMSANNHRTPQTDETKRFVLAVVVTVPQRQHAHQQLPVLPLTFLESLDSIGWLLSGRSYDEEKMVFLDRKVTLNHWQDHFYFYQKQEHLGDITRFTVSPVQNRWHTT